MNNGSLQERRTAFRKLHENGCFVLPNPWDAGGAMALAKLGFKALATTSSGYAWSCGAPDGALSREQVLEHIRTLVQATHLPVNADFESGFGRDPDEVHESVRMAVDAGASGISIEDSTGDPRHPLRSIEESVARLKAAREAIDSTGGGVMLIGRAENFFVGRPDLEDAAARIRAYAEAGADCLYAPGIKTPEQIRAIVTASGGKPVNLLIGSPTDMTVQDAADLGVRRISVGGGLARSAWAGFLDASRAIIERGDFSSLTSSPSGAELNRMFGD